jgi:hypothetical protein
MKTTSKAKFVKVEITTYISVQIGEQKFVGVILSHNIDLSYTTIGEQKFVGKCRGDDPPGRHTAGKLAGWRPSGPYESWPMRPAWR